MSLSQACSANLPLFEECLSMSSSPLLPPSVHGHRLPPNPATASGRVLSCVIEKSREDPDALAETCNSMLRYVECSFFIF